MSHAPSQPRHSDAATSAPLARILVVDDSPSSRAYILNTLATLPNVICEPVETGMKALQALERSAYSLVLCDYEMPGMSGLNVLAWIRSRHSALELPVLMLTSRDEAEVKVRAFRAGANDYIGKQARPEELVARVGTQIALLQAQRRLATERLRSNEAQKFAAIGHLAETLSHELNTPAQYIGDNLEFLGESFAQLNELLTQLQGLTAPATPGELAGLLQRADCDYVLAEIPRCIDESLQGVRHMASIVALMREFTRAGAGRHVEHDLNAIVNTALAVTRGHWHQVAELQLELATDLPAVPCLGASIKQVVLYAILNAVRSMLPPDGVQRERAQLRVCTRRLSEDWVAVEVHDSGRGLSAELLDSIFDPVLRARPAQDATEALVHARAVIVDDHGGKLQIESSEHGGTRVQIELPLTPAPSARPAR